MAISRSLFLCTIVACMLSLLTSSLMAQGYRYTQPDNDEDEHETQSREERSYRYHEESSSRSSQRSESSSSSSNFWDRYDTESRKREGERSPDTHRVSGSGYAYQEPQYESRPSTGPGGSYRYREDGVVTPRHPKADGGLTMLWELPEYALIMPFGTFISNDLGYSGLGVEALARFTIVKQESSLFYIPIGASFFWGQQGNLETTSLAPRLGVGYQTSLTLDQNPNDLVLDFQFGIGYDWRFGRNDPAGSSDIFFWGRFTAFFAQWEGLGGVRPRILWELNAVTVNGGLGSKLAAQVALIHSESEMFFLGPVWAYTQMQPPGNVQVNGIGLMGEYMFLINSTSVLGIQAEVLYNTRNIGAVRNAWSATLGLAIRF